MARSVSGAVNGLGMEVAAEVIGALVVFGTGL
jgi:hypothetical protein